MPTYAYQCRSCDSRFEARQSFSDDPLTECAVCGEEGSVFRVIQPAGIVFKGSGWYVTDSRGKNPANNIKSNGNGTNGGSNGSNGNGSSNGSSETSKADATDTASDTKVAATED